MTQAKTSNLNVRLGKQDAETLRQYPQTRAVELLASGLRLGAGNLPELSSMERAALREALSGSVVDALWLRHLADEVAELEWDGAAALAGKLRGLGDWELLALTLSLS